MTETKWTPGPWRKNNEFPYDTVASSKHFICQVFPTYDDKSKYNADLISAAPELYTATDWANGLIPLLEVSEDKEITFVQIQLSSDAIRALIDARRKARGE